MFIINGHSYLFVTPRTFVFINSIILRWICHNLNIIINIALFSNRCARRLIIIYSANSYHYYYFFNIVYINSICSVNSKIGLSLSDCMVGVTLLTHWGHNKPVADKSWLFVPVVPLGVICEQHHSHQHMRYKNGNVTKESDEGWIKWSELLIVQFIVHNKKLIVNPLKTF